MKTIVVPAAEDVLDEVQEFIGEELERSGCSDIAQSQIELAVEEIFVNIASYAYSPGRGEVKIRCEAREDPIRVSIQFLDHGRPYDPLAKEDADTSVEALEEREGGLGILLAKKVMDDVSYSYEKGENILTITKKL